MKKIILIVLVVLLLCGCKNKDIEKEQDNEIDYSDVSNVREIDSKLGSDIKITSGYLMTYITKKSGIWYMSEGTIKEVSSNNSKTIYKISDDNNHVLSASIDSEKEILKKNTKAYFVFTIDLSNGNLKLVKISNDPIDYSSVINIEFEDLYKNINDLLKTYFIINGYLVTEGEKYYLYENRASVEKESKDHFVIYWDGPPKYTGNANAKLGCKINNLYSLKDCYVIK